MISFILFLYIKEGMVILFFTNFIKGIIIGIGKVIPGVSGAILAASLGIYEKGLEILSNLRTQLLKNIKFVLSVGLGILFAMVLGSKLILYLLNNHYLITMFSFMGMIIGGIKPICNKIYEEFNIKNLLIFLTSFFAIILLSFIEIKSINADCAFVYILSGISEAISTVVPGISGTALLMIIGTYDEIMQCFANLFSVSTLFKNLIVLIPFTLGFIIGIIVISKILNNLFNKYKIRTYYAIIGFSLSSIVIMFIQTLDKSYSFMEILLSFICFIIGYEMATKIPE